MNDPVAKSRQLLIANLTPEQRHEFEAENQFTVRTGSEEYRHKPEITERISDGTRYCAILPDTPVYDQMLARKLHLERDPDTFFRVANVFGVPRSRLSAIDSWFDYFRVAVFHECDRYGMDRRLIEIQQTQDDLGHRIQIGLRYANRYNYMQFLDADHIRCNNLADILRTTAEVCVGGLNNYITAEISRNTR